MISNNEVDQGSAENSRQNSVFTCSSHIVNEGRKHMVCFSYMDLSLSHSQCLSVSLYIRLSFYLSILSLSLSLINTHSSSLCSSSLSFLPPPTFFLLLRRNSKYSSRNDFLDTPWAFCNTGTETLKLLQVEKAYLHKLMLQKRKKKKKKKESKKKMKKEN